VSYSLSYLPSFQRDLAGIVDYITTTLEAPKSALELIDAVEAKCNNLLNFPFAHRRFQTSKHLEREYRVITVKNYLVFYSVIENTDTIEIHRIIYKKRDLTQLLS
jgi:addiction module RelE/StbE family toxin